MIALPSPCADPDLDLLDPTKMHNSKTADALRAVAYSVEVMLVGMGAEIERNGPVPEGLDAIFFRMVGCACDLRNLATEITEVAS